MIKILLVAIALGVQFSVFEINVLKSQILFHSYYVFVS